MRYRALGTTGLNVSEIGFGGWGIGGRSAGETSYGATDDDRSRAALARAVALGITFFDTANVYGDGHSERLIGAGLQADRARVIIATKAGLGHFGDTPDFAPDSLRRSLADSLARLQTDYIDLFQLHDPPPDLFERAPEISVALEDMRRAGLIRCFGISVKSPSDALALIARHDVGAIQVNLNMLDIRAIELGLLERARERGIGVVARTPLSFGFLAGGVTEATEFPPGDHRRLWPRAQIERWIAGARDLHDAAAAPRDQSPGQVALRFCLSFPAVSSAIPGMLDPAEAAENARASELGPLPQSALDRIMDLHRTRTFFVRHA